MRKVFLFAIHLLVLLMSSYILIHGEQMNLEKRVLKQDLNELPLPEDQQEHLDEQGGSSTHINDGPNLSMTFKASLSDKKAKKKLYNREYRQQFTSKGAREKFATLKPEERLPFIEKFQNYHAGNRKRMNEYQKRVYMRKAKGELTPKDKTYLNKKNGFWRDWYHRHSKVIKKNQQQ